MDRGLRLALTLSFFFFFLSLVLVVVDVDGVSHYERSERTYWPGQSWKRQQFWGRTEQHHNNNRSVSALWFLDQCERQHRTYSAFVPGDI